MSGGFACIIDSLYVNRFPALSFKRVMTYERRVCGYNYIIELCKQYPDLDTYYNLSKNKGYGAKVHMDGIRKYGITKWHRKSFGICKTSNVIEIQKKVQEGEIDVEKEEVLRSLVERLELDLRTDEKDLEALGEEFARLQERLNAFDNRESQTKERSEKLRFDLQELKSSLDENIQTRKNVERSLEDTNQEISKAREKFKEISERLQFDELESNKATETVKNLKDKILN